MGSDAVDRDLDVVLWGVTGWTGVHLVEYFLKNYAAADSEIKWGMACRSEKKFDTVKTLLISEFDCFEVFSSEKEVEQYLSNIPVFFVSNDDEQGVSEVVKKTKSVISVVGPFVLYGETLLKHCALNGTHYVDITGEAEWIEDMMSKYGPEAEKSGAWIVPSCGFDSVPTEITTYVCLQELKRTAKDFSACTVEGQLVKQANGNRNPTIKNQAPGGGGSVKTFLTFMDKPSKPQEVLPKNPKSPVKSRDLAKLGLPPYRSYFLMAEVNQKAVYRSKKCLPSLYPETLIYTEGVLVKSYMKGKAVPAAVGVFEWAVKNPITKSFVRAKLPQPSQLPVKLSKEHQIHGIVEFLSIGTAKSGEKYYCKMDMPGEPAWTETSKMAAEAALCLANDVSLAGIKESTGRNSGFFSSACLGSHYIERLKARNVKFTMDKL